jgi:hypothetical protein
MTTAFARTLSLALVLTLGVASASTGYAATAGRGGGASSGGGSSAGGGNRTDQLNTVAVPANGDCRGNTCAPRYRLRHVVPCGSERYVGPAGEGRVNCRVDDRY